MALSMSPSKVLEKLRAGKIVNCFKVNIGATESVELAALAGYDSVWLDMEHVPTDWDVLDKEILAAKAYGVDAMVRVVRGPYSNYIRPLELDAAGIMVPHVMSEADARDVVRMTRFQPVGRRPIDGGNRDGAYCQIDMVEYTRQANAGRFVIVQIEDPEPLDDLEGICSVEGIDMIFFGPGDFSHGSGILGQWDHPKIAQALRLIAEAARAHGRFLGAAAGLDGIPALIELGYQFFSVGADVVGLGEYCRDQIAKFRKAVEQASGAV